ncbi:MAG TPA: YdcH family protein [Candidatus Solibacter sp.]|nr:YdcH family protein [Candidatus Solibacter sp.]
MAVSPQEVREILMARDADFQRLAQEHSQYEMQIDRLSHQTYLNSEDLLLEIELKKRRLRVKDEMEILLARRRREFDNR